MSESLRIIVPEGRTPLSVGMEVVMKMHSVKTNMSAASGQVSIEFHEDKDEIRRQLQELGLNVFEIA